MYIKYVFMIILVFVGIVNSTLTTFDMSNNPIGEYGIVQMKAHNHPQQPFPTGEFILYTQDSTNINNGSVVLFSSLKSYFGEDIYWSFDPVEKELMALGVVGVIVRDGISSENPGFEEFPYWDGRCVDNSCTLPIAAVSDKTYIALLSNSYNGTSIFISSIDENPWELVLYNAELLVYTIFFGSLNFSVTAYSLYCIAALIYHRNFHLNVGTVCVVLEMLNNLCRAIATVIDCYGFQVGLFGNITYTGNFLLTVITSTLVMLFWQDATSAITAKIPRFLSHNMMIAAIALIVFMLALELTNNVIYTFYSVFEIKWRTAAYVVVSFFLALFYFITSYKMIRTLRSLSISSKRKIRANIVITKIVVCGLFHVLLCFGGFLLVAFSTNTPALYIFSFWLAHFALVVVSAVKILLFTTTKTTKSPSTTKSAPSTSKEDPSSHNSMESAPASIV
eukprot:TRINITY_DN1257_c0_g1_i6.p1 TRINITY_DN1257_c0_g1~~TRINITY_DN1257_c0_g1_i6.p1  ORF type:complete len:449 (+),score=35.51 TRINITY_DN1257_c0_g1_i6:804-2150(+)